MHMVIKPSDCMCSPQAAYLPLSITTWLTLFFIFFSHMFTCVCSHRDCLTVPLAVCKGRYTMPLIYRTAKSSFSPQEVLILMSRCSCRESVEFILKIKESGRFSAHGMKTTGLLVSFSCNTFSLFGHWLLCIKVFISVSNFVIRKKILLTLVGVIPLHFFLS